MPRVQKKIRIYNAQILGVDTTVNPHRVVRADMASVFHYVSTLPFNRLAATNAYVDDEQGKMLSMYVSDDGSVSGIVKGRFASTRYDLLPQIEQDGMITDPTIPVGAGFYDPIHFVYFLDSNRVAMEVNGHGPSYGKFGVYLESKLAGHPTVNLTDAALFPLITADVYRQLTLQGTVAEIELDIYRGYGTTVRNVANGLGDVLTAMDKLPDGPTVFRIGLKGETTPGARASIGQAMQQEIVSLLRDARGTVSRAVARVRQPNPATGRQRTDPVDLLEAKAVFYARPVEVRSRVLDSDSMYAEIITGYQNFVQDEVR